jgi:hypothetical protein
MWRAQLQRSMRPMPVVVRGISGKHAAQVSFPEDQHPVDDLGSDGHHEPFGAPVAARSTDSQSLLRGRLGFVGLARRHDLPLLAFSRTG